MRLCKKQQKIHASMSDFVVMSELVKPHARKSKSDTENARECRHTFMRKSTNDEDSHYPVRSRHINGDDSSS